MYGHVSMSPDKDMTKPQLLEKVTMLRAELKTVTVLMEHYRKHYERASAIANHYEPGWRSPGTIDEGTLLWWE